MRVAIVDPIAAEHYPTGKCARGVAIALAGHHDVTVFSTTFAGPPVAGARFVKVPAISKVGLTLLPTFWVGSWARTRWERARRGRFDVVVTLQGYSPVATIRYAHRCHAVPLDAEPTPGLRGAVQRLTNRLQIRAEALAYRRAPAVVAVSAGLAGDLAEHYPRLAERTVVVPNFVDLSAHERPADFDRDAHREGLGFGPDDRVLVLVAHGHFEHKGLPQVLAAMAAVDDPHLRLLVVGGSAVRVRDAERDATAALGPGRATFTGASDDVRPYYWSADVFVLPTRYETFSFVAHEAAAAGLPIVATRVHGIADLLAAGAGWPVDLSVASVTAALGDVAASPPTELAAIGERARAAVAHLGRERFEDRWRDLVVALAAVGGDAAALPAG